MRLPIRQPVAGRRSRRPRRRRRPVGWWRLAGVLLMAGAGGGVAWLTSSDEFRLEPADVQVSGLYYTDAQVLRSTIGPWLEAEPNLFRLAATEMESVLRGLPAVAAADVRAVLPDRLLVDVVERVPVFVWRTPVGDYLVDTGGVLLRQMLDGEALPAGLPLLEDERSGQTARVGETLEGVDREAVLKLAAIDPALLDSGATTLQLSADDRNGYVLAAQPTGWQAIFGHYTPTLRPPEIIDRQVQCLRSLLAQDEESLETIYLSPADERCGTYVARPTPEPSAAPQEEEPDDDEP